MDDAELRLKAIDRVTILLNARLPTVDDPAVRAAASKLVDAVGAELEADPRLMSATVSELVDLAAAVMHAFAKDRDVGAIEILNSVLQNTSQEAHLDYVADPRGDDDTT